MRLDPVQLLSLRIGEGPRAREVVLDSLKTKSLPLLIRRNCRHWLSDKFLMRLLVSKLDIVFKLLFAHPNNRDILISLLTSVIRPASPIASVDVLNPEVPKELPDDKGTFLDIHVRMADGRHVDVEMQSALHPVCTTARGFISISKNWLQHCCVTESGPIRIKRVATHT